MKQETTQGNAYENRVCAYERAMQSLSDSAARGWMGWEVVVVAVRGT